MSLYWMVINSCTRAQNKEYEVSVRPSQAVGDCTVLQCIIVFCKNKTRYKVLSSKTKSEICVPFLFDLSAHGCRKNLKT